MIFDRLIQRRAHPANPSQIVLSMFNGGLGAQTYTGKQITGDKSLSISAVWAAVTAKAQDMAGLPIKYYQIMPDGTKKNLRGDRIWKLLNEKANDEMDSFQYREFSYAMVDMYGNAYSYIDYNNNGEIKGLWPLIPTKMVVKRIYNKDKTESALVFTYSDDRGTTVFSPKSIWHVRGFSTDGIMGVNTTDVAKEIYGLSAALEEYAARYFGNNAKPPAVLVHPGKVGEKAHKNLKASWSEAHQGLSQAHKIAILEEGMQLKEFGFSPEDSQSIESRKFQIEEVARITNMPLHRLKHLEKVNYNSIEHADIEYGKYTLHPLAQRFDKSAKQQIVPVRHPNRYLKHNLNGIYRADIDTRTNAYQRGQQGGYMSINDILDFEDRDPVPGGDIRMFPANMLPLDMVADYFNAKIKSMVERVIANDTPEQVAD